MDRLRAAVHCRNHAQMLRTIAEVAKDDHRRIALCHEAKRCDSEADRLERAARHRAAAEEWECPSVKSFKRMVIEAKDATGLRPKTGAL